MNVNVGMLLDNVVAQMSTEPVGVESDESDGGVAAGPEPAGELYQSQ